MAESPLTGIDHNVLKKIVGYLGLGSLSSLICTCQYFRRHLQPMYAELAPELNPRYRYNYEQARVVDELLALQRAKPGNQFLIKADVGSGKTLTALRLAIKLNLKKIIVLAPLNLLDQWCSEIAKFYPTFTCHKAHGKGNREQSKIINAQIIVTTSQTFSNICEKTRYGVTEILGGSIAEYTVIIDEIHNKTVASRLIPRMGIVIGLSAEKAAVDKLKNPHVAKMVSLILPRFKINFVPIVFPDDGKARSFALDNNVHLELRMLPKDLFVMHGNPGIVVAGHKYNMHPGEYLDKSMSEIQHELSKRYNYAYLIHYIREWTARGEKGLVLFASPEHCAVTAWYLTLFGIQANLIVSTKGVEIRVRHLNDFKSCGTVLLSTYKIMSEGLNLPQANNLIFFELATQVHHYTQAIGRMQRVGQTHSILNVYVITNTNGSRIYNQTVGYL